MKNVFSLKNRSLDLETRPIGEPLNWLA